MTGKSQTHNTQHTHTHSPASVQQRTWELATHQRCDDRQVSVSLSLSHTRTHTHTHKQPQHRGVQSLRPTKVWWQVKSLSLPLTHTRPSVSSYLCLQCYYCYLHPRNPNSSNSIVTCKERSLNGLKLDRKLKAKKLNASFSVRWLCFYFEGKILDN